MILESEPNSNHWEIKNEFSIGVNKTLMARLLDAPGKLIQRMADIPKPVPLAFSVTVLAIAILILLELNFFLLSRVTKAATSISPRSAIFMVEILVLVVVISYCNFNRVLFNIRDSLVDFIETSKNLSNLQEWLSLCWSSSTITHFFIWWIIITSSLVAFVYMFDSQREYSSLGLILPYLFSIFLLGICFYYVLLMLLLPKRLRQYHLKLYGNDPARSQVIEETSNILNRYAYGYVLNVAIVQISIITLHLPIISQVLLTVIFGWIPATTQYLANQTCVRSIISSSKRKTLDRIQTEIQILHEGDIKCKENMETINRLMDYYERIRVTPNSTLDMKSIGNFLNQLAIPLLGFLIANISKISDLFR